MNSSKKITILNYSVEFIPTEYHAGGTLLYINNKSSYELGQGPCIYISSELGITNQKKSSLVVYISPQISAFSAVANKMPR